MGDDVILVFTDETLDPGTEPGPVRRGLGQAVQAAATRASGVTVETLQENMRRFLAGLGAILEAAPKDVGGLELQQMEISVQVDGKGNVGLVGLANTTFGAQAGIKLILRKPS